MKAFKNPIIPWRSHGARCVSVVAVRGKLYFVATFHLGPNEMRCEPKLATFSSNQELFSSLFIVGIRSDVSAKNFSHQAPTKNKAVPALFPGMMPSADPPPPKLRGRTVS